MDKKREQKYIRKLIKQQMNTCVEEAHVNADAILCELLIEIGYGQVVTEYGKVDKWYG